MKYNYSISKIIRDAGNRVIVYGSVKTFLEVFLSPWNDIQTKFHEFINSNRERHQFNSQRISFEARLNNLFDPTQRRIYIQTIPPIFAEYFYTSIGSNKTFVYSVNNTENRLYIYRQSTYQSLAAFNINFVVYIPTAVLSAKREEIASEVRYYAFAGKKWILQPDDEIIVIPTSVSSSTLTS